MILFQNEYFSISEKEGNLFIRTFSSGFSIRDFQGVAEAFPRMVITNFLGLKNALEKPVGVEIAFGRLKPRIELLTTSDNLEAKIYIHLSKEELEATKEMVRQEVLQLLKENGIVYGIIFDVINRHLEVQKDLTVARGKLPVQGRDAQVVYVEQPERKPFIKEDGSTDYYEMHLFSFVKKGDWLGEKVTSGTGEAGINIKGEPLPAKIGKDKILRYDTKSVEGETQENKILLRAKFDGVLQIKDGKIGVVDHLIIDGDVNFETGNIDFNGYVTIHGTVEDGFTVKADKDISILGSMGIGAIEKIISREGSIYIKGGVSGKGKALIEAGQSVFVKYANACAIKAQDAIHIGYYALDSYLEADSVLVEAVNGRTIGGSIQAKSKVLLRTVGNAYEKRTNIQVTGFDRKAIKRELDDLLLLYKRLLNDAERNSRELKLYETTLKNSEEIKNTEEYIHFYRVHEEIMNQIYTLEAERKNMMQILSSKGDGEVSIYEKAYPQTILQIKNIQKRIKQVTSGTFYALDNKLMFD